MKTVLDVLMLSTQYLEQQGIQNARRQAENLVSDALKMPRLNLYLDFDRPLSEVELETCRHYLSRRAKGEPLQYIHGEVEFYNCQIAVDQSVLIPRQETEILVDKIVKQLECENLEGKELWDVCCGSGCIAIALKKKFPQLQVFASDISEKSLEIAKKNASVNQVEVKFLLGDLFQPFQGRKANFLVCNPPYIAEHEFSTLDVEVRRYEPRLALVSGPTGLECYKRISQELKFFLATKAMVWFEIGSQQGSAVCNLFSQAGWASGRIDQDWSGQDRFFFLENE